MLKVKNTHRFLKYCTLNLNKNHHIVDISLHYVNFSQKQPLGLCHTAFYHLQPLGLITHHFGEKPEI